MIDKVLSILGGNLFEGVSSLIKTFVTNPTEALKAEHALLTLRIETERRLAELEVQDRDSARKREMETKDRIPGLLAGFITAGFFGGTFWFAYHPVAPGTDQLVHDMLLTLRDGWFAVVMYYFGSSLGSSRKDRLIANGGNGK